VAVLQTCKPRAVGPPATLNCTLLLGAARPLGLGATQYRTHTLKDTMPTPLTPEYVEKRFGDFVAKYQQVLTAYGHDKAEVEKNTAMLRDRLTRHDYVLKAERPVCHYHSGKRVTWFLVKQAILYCPAEKARIARLRARYSTQCSEARARNPFATFFSFEAACAKDIRVDLRRHRDAFRL